MSREELIQKAKRKQLLEQARAKQSVGNPQRANQILNDGIMIDFTPEQTEAVTSTSSPQDLEMQTYIAYESAKRGTNFTPEMATAQMKYEYGDDATPQVANQMNKKAAKWQKPKPYTNLRRWTDPETGLSVELPSIGIDPPDPSLFQRPEKTVANALGSFVERVKAGAKAMPELTTSTLINISLQSPVHPMGIQATPDSSEEYKEMREKAFKQIEETPVFKDLRKSMLPNIKSADEFAAKYKGSKAQSLIESAKEGNWGQFGEDLHDAFALETPNFAAIMALSMANPALGLSYAGTSSAADRYATGISEGESPADASAAAVAYGLAEVGFEWAGSIGMISGAIKRRAKGEVIEGFGRKALEFAREPGTEIATQITQNTIDGRPWYEGVPEAGLVGLGFGAGIMSFSLGDANRINKKNTNEQIAEIIANDPVLNETPERAALAKEALETPTEQSVEALNNDIFTEPEQTEYEKQITGEQAARIEKDEGVTTPEGKPAYIEKEQVLDDTGKPVEEGEEETRITVEADNLLREEYGIENTEEPDVRAHASLIQESIEAGRDVNVLLDELRSNPRPTTDSEAADIAGEKARLSKDLKKNKKALFKAIDSGNEVDIEKYSAEKRSLDKRLIDFTDVARLAKTETGRALSAYNLTLNKEKDLTDHINDATVEKGGKLTDKEYKSVEDASNNVDETEQKIDEISGEPKDIAEKIQELRDNIDQKKRTVEKTKDPKKKSEQQKQLELLKEIQRDQDTMFELIKQLDEQTAKLADPKIKNDPEGYKSTIEILLELRNKSKWWKDLQNSKIKSDKQRVKLLNDVLDNLQAQYDGKFRDVKTKKTEVTTDEIVDLKNKIAYMKDAMNLEDKIASIDEDIRLIGEGRSNEVTKPKSANRESKRDEKLNHLHNELANKRRRLETLKSDLGTGKVIKFLEFQRAMKLSLDSWLLRQGGPSLKSNPFLTLDAWFKSFAGFSEAKFYETQRTMESTQSFKDSKDKMGVVYNDIDAGFEQHQEAINSSLAEKIPPVRGSNRHMVLGVNLLRWNWSRKILNKYPNESPEFYQAAGKFINDLTGRGGLGSLEKSARGLTAAFTAPRYTTSKWSNIFNLRRAWVEKDGKKEFNKDLAKEVAGQKARMFSGFAGMATALIAMGFEMGTDPEDPLFMKFRKGKVVIDIAPHMTAELRMMALYMEAFAANSLGIGELEGEYDVDMFNKTLRYAGYKVVPTFGTLMELAEGETIVGEDRSLLETLALYPMPIMVEGMYQDLIKDQEELSDIITSGVSQFIGGGGGIYDDTAQYFERIGD